MVNAFANPDFFVREGGGGRSKPNGEKTALIFFNVCFLLFFSPKFSGDAGWSNYLRGGGVGGGGVGFQMLISIEFDRTCDLPGMGSGPPTPPPPPLDLHMHDI